MLPRLIEVRDKIVRLARLQECQQFAERLLRGFKDAR
jgi:hypothetical protein